DGIRDATVTGVQTCALPISGSETLVRPLDYCSRPSQEIIRDPETSVLTVGVRPLRQETIACHSFTCVSLTLCCNFSDALTATTRSEERRVGKECRYTS